MEVALSYREPGIIAFCGLIGRLACYLNSIFVCEYFFFLNIKGLFPNVLAIRNNFHTHFLHPYPAF